MDERARYIEGCIDTHAHLSLFEHRGLESRRLVHEAVAGGLARIVDVGVTPSDYMNRLCAFGEHPIVAFTAGLHPTSVTPDTVDAELGVLESVFSGPVRIDHAAGDVCTGSIGSSRPVAVGEVGLDFYHSADHRKLQVTALERQADLAARKELPLVLHNRSSEDEMLAFLRRARPPGVMHCFSQTVGYCRSCLDLGLYVSFGGNLTYRGSHDLREAAAIVPEDRLLVETDAPYLAPQAVRGRANHPGYLAYTIDALASIRGTTSARIAAITAANALALFAIEPWPATGP